MVEGDPEGEAAAEEGREEAEPLMLIRIGPSTWVPMSRIERISFFSDYASVRFIDVRDPELIRGEDAQRLRLDVESATVSRKPAEPEKGRRR